jgi:menaquinone-dependent protoporphyrinogen oxidase
MDILIVYGTSEGQTRKVAGYAAEGLRRSDHNVIVADATGAISDLDLSLYDAVILASRVHAGRHHPAIVWFARHYRRELAHMETAFLAVSMSAARHVDGDDKRLTQYQVRLIGTIGWSPQIYHDVAGARMYTQHNRLSRWLLGWVDKWRYDTSKDHEFTDWHELGTFIERWAMAANQR